MLQAPCRPWGQVTVGSTTTATATTEALAHGGGPRGPSKNGWDKIHREMRTVLESTWENAWENTWGNTWENTWEILIETWKNDWNIMKTYWDFHGT